jgi:salicylate hydroxylase
VSARTIVVAGAGIGGLTTALALADKGFRVEVFDKAERLEESGAGIQLSPNATRILLGLGLRDRLEPHVVAPDAVLIKTARGRQLGRIRLDARSEKRWGAPYWIIHRGDLQAALAAAVADHHDVTLTLGATVDEFAVHPNGVTVHAMKDFRSEETHGVALVGADGLWSTLRRMVGETDAPMFASRSAWRALVPAAAVTEEFRAPAVHLWLGEGAHLVHYPVKGGAMINIVAIADDAAPSAGWSTAAAPDEVLSRFPAAAWAAPARDLLAAPTQWLKWPLYARRPMRVRDRGPTTLVGDAAHPMLPYLAQGAAMAIEDAAVLANRMAETPQDPAAAMRRYERARRRRIAKVRAAVRRNERVYHQAGMSAALRNAAMGLMGSTLLRARFNWLYKWRPK